jgi:hypothetical protein
MWEAVKKDIRATGRSRSQTLTDRVSKHVAAARSVGDNAPSKYFLRQRFGRYAVALLIAGDLLA